MIHTLKPFTKTNRHKRKIACIGIRGIPVVYSGFESFVEDLVSSITHFSFYVYCRNRYVKKTSYKGATLLSLPTLYHYKWETFIHSLLSSVHAVLFLKPHVILYLGVGNAPFLLIPRLFHIRTIINVDGMDWEREKWGWVGKWYLSSCAYLCTRLADTIVTDSTYSTQYYIKKFNKKTVYIPYMSGGYRWKEDTRELSRYDLTPHTYFVWAGRLVPDNHLDDLIDAYLTCKTNKKLVIIGDDNYQTKYLRTIKEKVGSHNKIIQTGFLPRDRYLTLIKHSYAYIETKQSGGTHPTLLDGLTHAPRVICNDFTANKAICGTHATFYSRNKRSSLQKLMNNPPKKKNLSKLGPQYDPHTIVKQYSDLFII